MSYNLPGQNTGFVRTDAPSTPCTGDFVEKLNCTEHGFFFWIGAFCVLVVLCGLCSCYVVAPLFKWYRARHEKTPGSATTTAGGRQGGDTKKKGRGSTKKTTPSSSDPKKSQHWYLHNMLQIGSDDEKEYGPRPSHQTTRAPSHGSTRHTTPANPHDAAAAREDPGIGAEATARGGGWMGAANGRL